LVIYIIFISFVSTSIDSGSSFPTSKAHVLAQFVLATATADAMRRLAAALAAATAAEGRPGSSCLAASATDSLLPRTGSSIKCRGIVRPLIHNTLTGKDGARALSLY